MTDYQTALDALAVISATKLRTPWKLYKPHPNFQQQFHASKHTVRCLFPGNRGGKTTAAAMEAQWQAGRKADSIILWITTQFRTFEMLRPQLEAEIFGPDAKYNAQDYTYTWPNGSTMWVIPRERDWSFVQGINPDLVCVDEECPIALWRELRSRGFGRNNTRYVIAATATNMAGSWMEKEIYLTWLELHTEKGLSERQAMDQQLHPEMFVWPRGGIADNPSMTPEKVAKFKALTWSSDKEKKVRDEGGFETSVGDAVFDWQTMETLRTKQATDQSTHGDGVCGALDLAKPLPNKQLHECDPPQLVGQKFIFTPLTRGKDRIQFWESPVPGHIYVVGADFAYGIQGRDFDAAVILDATALAKTGQAVQVGELHGHWGETFDTALYAAIRYWADAFLLGERQVGLFTLKRLWSKYSLRYMYYHRDLNTGQDMASDVPALGWHRSGNDLAMREFRLAAKQGHMLLRSQQTIEQMGKLQWVSKAEEGGADREPDERLKMKLQGGGSPDLVMAAMYANFALSQVHQFEKPEPVFMPGSYGDVFGLEKTLPELFKPKSQATFIRVS